jgi:hypothetical protein
MRRKRAEMNYIRSGEFLLTLIFICGLLAFAVPVKAQRVKLPRTDDDGTQNNARMQQRQRRLAPPPGLACDADYVTSFTGRVLSYSRRSDRIFIRVRTDEATTEAFTIAYTQTEDLLKKFQLYGQPLGQEGLEKIESHWRRDKRNVRATVWACYDKEWRNPSAILIDWHVGKPKPPHTL